MDTHRPNEILQIDGNFGGSAGIMEMLMQCANGVIYILPALPQALDHGSVRAMRAKGGFELSFRWEQRRLSWLSIRSDCGNLCRIAYDAPLQVTAADGAEPADVRRDPKGILSFRTAMGAVYTMQPQR